MIEASSLLNRDPIGPDAKFIAYRDKLETQQASRLAQRILKKPLEKRTALYIQHIKGEVSARVRQRFLHVFVSHIPAHKDCNFHFLAKEELKSLNSEKLYADLPNWDWPFLVVEGSDFAISKDLPPPQNPEQLIPDCTVKIGEETFQVNSYLLSQLLNRFASKFQADNKELDLSGILSKEEFFILVQYMYGYPFGIKEKEFFFLAKCAFDFNIPDIEKFLVKTNYFYEIEKSSPPIQLSCLEKLLKIAPTMRSAIETLSELIKKQIGIDLISDNRPMKNTFTEQNHERLKKVTFDRLTLGYKATINQNVWSHLCGLQFNDLCINNCDGLKASDASIIGKMCLKTLSFYECGFLTTTFLKNLSFSTSIEELNIGCGQLGFDSPAIIAAMPIKELYLSWQSWLNRESIEVLSKSTSLESIHIKGEKTLSSIDVLTLFEIRKLKKFKLNQPVSIDFDPELISARAKERGIEFEYTKY